MWDAFVEKIRIIVEDPAIRNRVLFVLGALVVFRLLAAIPMPGINDAELQSFLSNNQFFGLLSVFSGSGFSTLSIVMLGVGPYITASIVMQLMTVLIPKLKEMYQEEGDAGRVRFMQYSRYLTVPLALIQSFGFILLYQQNGIIAPLTPLQLLTNMLVISAGSICSCGSENSFPSSV